MGNDVGTVFLYYFGIKPAMLTMFINDVMGNDVGMVFLYGFGIEPTMQKMFHNRVMMM